MNDALHQVPGHSTRRPEHRRTGHFVAVGLFERLETFRDLEARIAALPTQQDRGAAFEVFAEAYLATQKLVGAEEVWPADQVPIAVLRACCLPVQDMGADGVFKTRGGQYNAYQSKFRTGRPPLTWQELSTFMGLTDQVGGRVLFTNCDDLPTVMDDRSSFYCIRGADLERLTKDDLEEIVDWLRGAASAPKRKEPRSHQSEALEAILGGLEQYDRVTAVMACATGKTLVSMWVAERRKAKRVLVLVPSLALVRQTLHEWLKETQWDCPRFIAVCSDPTVAHGVEDALVVHQRDLDFPVTTDVGEVRRFLAAPSDRVQIVFSTYQSARAVGEAAQGMKGFDLCIFDEAHKTAGREAASFGFALEDRNVQIGKRVFLTATPRHYDVRKEDKEGDKALVYSMDAPAIYGPVVHTLSFAEAARRGIICNYKIIISIVTSEMVNADLLSRGEVIVDGDVVRARNVANQIAIEKACEAYDLKKILSFHRSVASARGFTGDAASSIKTHLPNYVTLHVNGEMQTARREKEMRSFREADRAIMSNARCLTEGVDVPAVDVVAFLTPRKSKVDIVQAAGRAMRKVDGKETGYVLLPLFLETLEDETLEEALERSDFGEAWDVLQAMQEQDGVLAEIVREIREERGRLGGFNDSRLHERIEVLAPEISLDVLRVAVGTALVDRLSVTWDERYGELKRYRDQNGDCNVPQRWNENPRLASWVTAQRHHRNTGRLTSARRERLDKVGFDWDPFHSAWDSMFLELQRYKDEQGDCNVPWERKRSPLAKWVNKQRTSHKKGQLSEDRKNRLQAIGFTWDAREHSWEANYQKLRQYKERFGDCNVPKVWNDPQLANWVGVQRLAAAGGKLSPVRKARLDGLGFNWNTREHSWDALFLKLRRYKKRFGHCDVPWDWKEDPALANWVHHQRRFSSAGSLSLERRGRLDDLGFVWAFLKDAVWESRFTQLKAYRERFGDCNVPASWKENRHLGDWAARLRRAENEGRLRPAQRAQLEALGFNWSIKESNRPNWESMFVALQNYCDEHGHCNVPQKWKKSPQLGNWVSTQRLAKTRGRLTRERETRLDAIGFMWQLKDFSWETRFTELMRFKQQLGHCDVPRDYDKNRKLGIWASHQRAFNRRGMLSGQRKARLDEIGFEWSPYDSSWNARFSELERYIERFGNSDVPFNWDINPQLALWVTKQRQLKRKKLLSAEREARLNSVGFPLEIQQVEPLP